MAVFAFLTKTLMKNAGSVLGHFRESPAFEEGAGEPSKKSTRSIRNNSPAEILVFCDNRLENLLNCPSVNSADISIRLR